MNDIQKRLFMLQDVKYKEFHSKLMPTIDKNSIIGIRTPVLKKFIKELDVIERKKFLESSLPHAYYEENNLHGFLISQIKDFNQCIYELNRFLPFVDNWATCDGLRPVCFKKNKDKLLKHIEIWLKSQKPYTIRFAIEMLMVHFLDEDFDEIYLAYVSSIKSDEYYVNMMIAWYFATALAKQYNITIKYIEQKVLPHWVHNKTIQKAVESYRISNLQKQYLKTLKWT